MSDSTYPHEQPRTPLTYQVECMERLGHFTTGNLVTCKLPVVADNLQWWIDNMPAEEITLDNSDTIEQVREAINHLRLIAPASSAE